MKKEMVKPCVLCGQKDSCRCKFKSPPKKKWNRKTEIYSTSPRRLANIFQEFADHFLVSIKSDREFIFKLSIIDVTPKEKLAREKGESQ